MRTTRDFVNHLRHCIQEEEGIALSDKSVEDITKTILGANRVVTKGAIENMKSWRSRYFDSIKK